MTNILLKILMILSVTVIYIKGETDTKWFGKCNKNWKLATGLLIAPLGAIMFHSWIPLLCWGTYAIACSFGYGDNNWLTKLIGKRNAIVFCGFILGLASMPILGFYGLLQALIAAGVWYIVSLLDDADIVKEPWIATLRGLSGTIYYII